MPISRYLTSSIAFAMLLISLHANATSVLPISLERMAATADSIFHGKAISNEVKLDPVSGRVATFTRFEIIESIKGESGSSRTIKQIGGQLPGSNYRQVIHGVPAFTVGQEYVVFLPKASSLGFASPIGLSQGKFDVQKIAGQSVIKDPRARAATVPAEASPKTTGLPSAIQANQLADSVEVTDFLRGVRSMVQE